MSKPTNEIPKRLTPTASTIRLLLAKSGNQCAFENCTEVIFNDAGILIGECCHIEAALPGGERFNENQSNEERRSFENLIFLCHKHHIETNDTNAYTTNRLKEIKQIHHNKFSEKQVSINPKYIDEVIAKFDLLSSNVEETLKTIKEVETKQDIIIELLNTQNKKDVNIEINEFFGPPTVTNFIGRKDELNELINRFEKFNTIIVQGVSGIGKSSIVANFVDTIKNYHVFWFNCDIVDNKESFLVTFSDFLIQNFNDYSLKKSLSEGSETLIVKNLIHLLNKYPVCIVYDALNDLSHELFSYSQIFNERINNSKLFITTTLDFDILSWSNHPFKFKLSGLTIEAFAKACEFYDLKNISSTNFNSLYKLTGGHPYLLKLASSIAVYYPIEDLIKSLNKGTTKDFETYVSSKIISKLSEEEDKLLTYILSLQIPFRYSLGDYLTEVPFSTALKSLQQKFLVEKTEDKFFMIPEYIKLNIQGLKNESEGNLDYKLLFEYLRGIKEKSLIIEKITLIDISLKINELDFAEKECMVLVSNLMGIGYFNLVVKYVEEFMASNPKNNWDFLFYALGRIYRMQKDYEKALKMYNNGIELYPNSELYSHFLFEKASILFYLSEIEDNNDYKNQSKSIYNNLSLLKKTSISIQSQLSLSRILIKEGEYKKVIAKIEKLANSVDFSGLDSYVSAQVWHTLGDAYSKDLAYKKAFESFDISIDYYKEALDKSGMNAFEGLYHLYVSYATTYSDAKDYISAAEMFGINVLLAKQFGFDRKHEQALLDYGYHLILSKEFNKAIEVLNEHYNIIRSNNTLEISELPFLYGCLAFAFWYAGDFLNSLELLGLYINASNYNGIRPLITIIERINENEDFDLIEYFKKGMKTLIIPKDKTFDDLKKWIDEVCQKNPELSAPLNSFLIFKKPS